MLILSETLLPLEHAHLTPGVRSSRAALEALLHESFTEIGASGRLDTRDALPPSPASSGRGQG